MKAWVTSVGSLLRYPGCGSNTWEVAGSVVGLGRLVVVGDVKKLDASSLDERLA